MRLLQSHLLATTTIYRHYQNFPRRTRSQSHNQKNASQKEHVAITPRLAVLRSWKILLIVVVILYCFLASVRRQVFLPPLLLRVPRNTFAEKATKATVETNATLPHNRLLVSLLVSLP